MSGHKLETFRNPVGVGWVGSCDCLDPSYEDGWYGQVSFAGDTKQEVEGYFHDHLIEESVA